MDSAFQLADVSVAQLALIGAAALGGSVLGGLAGYGTGLVVPIFLAPVVGVANVVPVMAVGMIFANGSRATAFWRDIHWPHVRRVLLFGLPACVAGAYSYTLLDARWVALLRSSAPLAIAFEHFTAHLRVEHDRLVARNPGASEQHPFAGGSVHLATGPLSLIDLPALVAGLSSTRRSGAANREVRR